MTTRALITGYGNTLLATKTVVELIRANRAYRSEHLLSSDQIRPIFEANMARVRGVGSPKLCDDAVAEALRNGA